MISIPFLLIFSFSQSLWANSEAGGETVATRMLQEQQQEESPNAGPQNSSLKGLLANLSVSQVPAIEFNSQFDREILAEELTYNDLLKLGRFFARDWSQLFWFPKNENQTVGKYIAKWTEPLVETFAFRLSLDSGATMVLGLKRSSYNNKVNHSRSENTLHLQDIYIRRLIEKLKPGANDPRNIQQWQAVRDIIQSPQFEGRYQYLKDYFSNEHASRLISGSLLARLAPGIRYYGEIERLKIKASREAAEALSISIWQVRQSALRLTSQIVESERRAKNPNFTLKISRRPITTEPDPVLALTRLSQDYIAGDRYSFDRSRGFLEALAEKGLITNRNTIDRLTFSSEHAYFEKELVKMIDALRAAYQQIFNLQARDGVDFGLPRHHRQFAEEVLQNSLANEDFAYQVTADFRRSLSARFKNLPMQIVTQSIDSCVLIFN